MLNPPNKEEKTTVQSNVEEEKLQWNVGSYNQSKSHSKMSQLSETAVNIIVVLSVQDQKASCSFALTLPWRAPPLQMLKTNLKCDIYRTGTLWKAASLLPLTVRVQFIFQQCPVFALFEDLVHCTPWQLHIPTLASFTGLTCMLLAC